ncbi:MAG: DUF1254 domain-containing protein [Burkholderiales bacterium]|nr:DUF1254 domain-containing protein [Burkholderiales bacterium]
MNQVSRVGFNVYQGRIAIQERSWKPNHIILKYLLPSIFLVASFAAAGVSAQTDEQARAFARMADEAAEEEAYAMGIDAYLYGYPRVEMARRMHNEMHRVREDQVIYAPVNRFYYFDRLARPGDGRVIKAPNNDTLYGSAYLDLSAGPVILRVPSMGERYYVALVVDAAGNVNTRISRTVSGPGGVDYVFAGPGYRGTVPAGAQVLQQTANDLWLLMRVASTGGDDEAAAAQILKRFTLREFDQAPGAPAVGANYPVDDLPVTEPLEPFNGLGFFSVLDHMIARNPVPADYQGLLLRWQRIGLGSGRYDPDGLMPPVRRGLERAIVAAERIVVAAQFGIANNVNGWNYSDKIGRIRNDWALNAAIARGGYGNLAEDSVYHQRSLDDNGQPLTGEREYTMTFAQGKLPPVGSFWSITAYDQNSFDLIENPIGRYSFGDRTKGVVRNSDGSLTIAIRHDAPKDPILRANWLPVGEGPFYLIIRTYDPAPEIAAGTWAPPPVIRIDD